MFRGSSKRGVYEVGARPDEQHRADEAREFEEDRRTHRGDEFSPRVRLGRLFLHEVKEDDRVREDGNDAVQEIQGDNRQRLQRCRWRNPRANLYERRSMSTPEGLLWCTHQNIGINKSNLRADDQR